MNSIFRVRACCHKFSIIYDGTELTTCLFMIPDMEIFSSDEKLNIVVIDVFRKFYEIFVISYFTFLS